MDAGRDSQAQYQMKCAFGSGRASAGGGGQYVFDIVNK